MDNSIYGLIVAAIEFENSIYGLVNSDKKDDDAKMMTALLTLSPFYKALMSASSCSDSSNVEF